MTATATTARPLVTDYQREMMREVIAEHGSATEHSVFCCAIAKLYTETLGEAMLVSRNDAVAEDAPRPSGNGNGSTGRRVAMANEKQLKFIASLLTSREVSDTERATWTKMVENGMSSREASSILDRLTKRPAIVTGAVRFPASPKQVDLITRLAEEKVWEGATQSAAIAKVLAGEAIEGKAASPLIDFLFACPAKPVDKKKEVGEEGVYLFEGEYYKVQRAVHGSGRLYSKKFDRETESWDRGGKLGQLTAEYKLTAEQASQFGELYGCCVRCSRTLTDEYSIENGYGRICGEKMGF